MQRSSKVYVAGHRGLVGSALVRALGAAGFGDLVCRNHDELDLADASATRAFLADERPEYVLLAAAKVGGILANDTHPAEFIRENLAIQTNVIHESWRAGVKRLLFLGSSCIYPRDCPQPIKEEYLLTGPLERTNEAYAVAKIAGVQMCASYNKQYGTQFLCAMPTNLYGPGDNYDLRGSHVVPALLRKAHEAKSSGSKSMQAWGTGAARREFLFSEDMADACVNLMSRDWGSLTGAFPERAPLINIGAGSDITIKELVHLVRNVVGFPGEIEWDASKPDGTPQKLLDITRISSLGWRARTGLEEGLRVAYREFLKTLPAAA